MEVISTYPSDEMLPPEYLYGRKLLVHLVMDAAYVKILLYSVAVK
jgi:hypothetical protein